MKSSGTSLMVCAAILLAWRPLPAQDSTSPATPVPGTAPKTPGYAEDPNFQKALEEAKEKKLPVEERMARWKRANKIANSVCVQCLREVIRLQMQQSQWKDAVASAKQLDLVATEPKDKFYAAAERGMALMHTGDGRLKPDQIKEAEASLRAALEISPKTKIVVYTEGRALAMLGRNQEAKEMFQHYIDMVGYSDSYRTRAEHFVEDPHLATMPMAPPFTLTTRDGEQMSLDDMGGKVVLLDFWATWCGPCKETLPEIKKIAKNFARQPLVVISISSDRDDVTWNAFVEKNEMTWPQYRDSSGALSRAYGVSSIPRFFTIDTDGVLQSVKVGSDSDPQGDVKRLVKKAVEAERKKAKVAESGASD